MANHSTVLEDDSSEALPLACLSQFENLVAEFESEVYRFASILLEDQVLAEEAQARVFASIFSSAGESHSAETTLPKRVEVLKTTMSVVQELQTESNTKLEEQVEVFQAESDLDTVSSSRLKHASRTVLLTALKQMPTCERAVYALKDIFGLRRFEILEVIECGESALTEMIGKARAAVRRAYTDCR